MKFEFSPHVALQVKNYDKAKGFYEKILGMEVISSSDNETHLKSGSMNFYMEDSPSGFVFFEFKVDDVNEARELLEREGCKVTQVYNEKSMMFADPYGMKFHIWQD